MEQFFTRSEAIRQIIKGLHLTKTLFVSSILVGERHIGKKRLIAHLFPQAPWVDGRDLESVKNALEEHDEIVITHFERISNHESLDFQNKRVIATADYIDNIRNIDDLFAFIYTVPPLRERPEDVAYLIKYFIREAKEALMIEDEIMIDHTKLDLSKNSKTLRKSVYHQVMYQHADEETIQKILYHFFIKHLEGKNGYKEHIHLFEKPLIEAGLEKFHSQLQLAQVLGINRNTLRKKIHEHAID
ncbi:MAG: Fis family transcriptional regulator [Sulfurovum sp.]|nr:MAG: Fis family transcriptional regulator [Sulfurovum sp.]